MLETAGSLRWLRLKLEKRFLHRQDSEVGRQQATSESNDRVTACLLIYY